MRILVDAGHGGKAIGCVNRTLYKDRILYEKDYTLPIALRLYQILKKYGHKVFLTRKRDETVLIKDRVKMAKEINPDLFISIHLNATARGKGGEGFEIYTNARGIEYAKRIMSSYATFFSFLKNRGIKGQTKNTEIINDKPYPAVLFEAFFLDNNEEAKKMIPQLDRIAEAIAYPFRNGDSSDLLKIVGIGGAGVLIYYLLRKKYK